VIKKVLYLLTCGFVLIFLVYPIALQFPIPYFEDLGAEIVRVQNPGMGLSIDIGQTCALPSGPCLKSFLIEGPILYGAAKKFKTKIDDLSKTYPNITLICLSSPGGLNREAVNIAAYINEKKMSTCVGDMSLPSGVDFNPNGIRYTSRCESACTFIVLAGIERIAIGDRFLFGLHSSRYNLATTSDNASTSVLATKESATLFKQYSTVAEPMFQKIVDATLRTPPDKIYYLSPQEQFQLGFFLRREGTGQL
jgi:hypothetical protein